MHQCRPLRLRALFELLSRLLDDGLDKVGEVRVGLDEVLPSCVRDLLGDLPHEWMQLALDSAALRPHGDGASDRVGL